VCEVGGGVFPLAKQVITQKTECLRRKKYDRLGGGKKAGGHRDVDE
jgi:hypothetical protein